MAWCHQPRSHYQSTCWPRCYMASLSFNELIKGHLYLNQLENINPLSRGKCTSNFKSIIIKPIITVWTLAAKLLSGECITWANANTDLCCHMASLGHNELIKLTTRHRVTCKKLLNMTFRKESDLSQDINSYICYTLCVSSHGNIMTYNMYYLNCFSAFIFIIHNFKPSFIHPKYLFQTVSWMNFLLPCQF